MFPAKSTPTGELNSVHDEKPLKNVDSSRKRPKRKGGIEVMWYRKGLRNLEDTIFNTARIQTLLFLLN